MPDVARQLQDRHGQVAEKNVEKLKAMLDIIIFCGKQNIPLRGHRNEAWNAESTEQINRWRGKSRELPCSDEVPT